MNEKSQVEAAWAAYTSGLQLSDEEQTHLKATLNDNSSGKELVEDQQMHRMLSAMASIDETKSEFVSDVAAACERVDAPERDTITILDRSTQNTQVPRTPVRQSAVPKPRKRNATALRNPLVLIFGGSALMMAVIMLLMVNRYDTAQQQVTDLQEQLRTQQSKFEVRLNTERNRLKSQPSTVSASGNSDETIPESIEFAPQPPMQFATSTPVAVLAKYGDAVWKNAPDAASLSAGNWDLESGTAELAMLGGSQIQIQAPATFELISPQHISLKLGDLTASIPADDIGFRISTPSARIVDLGTQFRVSVDNIDETDVNVDLGEVVVIPWDEEQGGKRWHLVAGEFDQATVSPSAPAGHKCLASRISGPSGFRGQILLAGASMNLSSRVHFDRLQNGITAQLATSPDDAIKNWLKLTRSFNATSGSIRMDGKDVPIEGLDGVLKFESSLMNPQPLKTDVDRQQSSSFSGSININGQQRSFSNQEEYEAFRKEMFQSLQDFNIPSPAQMQLELDRKTNPFSHKLGLE